MKKKSYRIGMTDSDYINSLLLVFK